MIYKRKVAGENCSPHCCAGLGATADTSYSSCYAALAPGSILPPSGLPIRVQTCISGLLFRSRRYTWTCIINVEDDHRALDPNWASAGLQFSEICFLPSPTAEDETGARCPSLSSCVVDFFLDCIYPEFIVLVCFLVEGLLADCPCWGCFLCLMYKMILCVTTYR